jgi:hypothetical protein
MLAISSPPSSTALEATMNPSSCRDEDVELLL